MALLKTNSKEYKRNIEAYIFDCINCEDKDLDSIQSKLEYALSEFNRVANYPYNLKMFPNKIDRMADYLQRGYLLILHMITMIYWKLVLSYII